MVFRKMNIFGDMKKFLGGRHKAGLFLGVISIHFKAYIKVQNGIFYGVAKISNMFWGYA